MKRRPCPSCPWRVSTKTSDIPGGALDHNKARAFMEPTSFKAMGCHLGAPEPGTPTSIPCAGFVLQVGGANLGIRVALLRGWFKLLRLHHGRAAPPDHGSDDGRTPTP